MENPVRALEELNKLTTIKKSLPAGIGAYLQLVGLKCLLDIGEYKKDTYYKEFIPNDEDSKKENQANYLPSFEDILKNKYEISHYILFLGDKYSRKEDFAVQQTIFDTKKMASDCKYIDSYHAFLFGLLNIPIKSTKRLLLEDFIEEIEDNNLIDDGELPISHGSIQESEVQKKIGIDIEIMKQNDEVLKIGRLLFDISEFKIWKTTPGI